MAKKKRRSGSRVSALSPVNKQGIKVGTLFTELGLGTAVYHAWKHPVHSSPMNNAAFYMRRLFDPSKTEGFFFLSGIGLALAGKLTGFRKVGVFQLS
jgi:hypothetical protein